MSPGRAAFGGEGEAALPGRFRRAVRRADGIPIDAADPVSLMLFPEMDATADVPEITTACWGILGKSPDRPDVRLRPDGGEAGAAPGGRRWSPAPCCPTIRNSSWARTLAEAARAGAR